MSAAIKTMSPTKRARRMAREPKPAVEAKAAFATPASDVQAKPIKSDSKLGMALSMLQRSEGATIAQLVTATNWLPHTTRAALTGLKRKGYQVTSTKAEGDERVYLAAVV